MRKELGYTSTAGNERFANRAVARYSAKDGSVRKTEPKGKTVFVPFTGFDGQALAGTGALVWEGELLQR